MDTVKSLEDWLDHGQKVPEEVLDKIKRRDIANIIMRVQAGKPLTAPQRKTLDLFETKKRRDLPDFANPETIGRLLGVSIRRVHQLAEDGIIKRYDQGRFPLPETVAEYIAHLKTGTGGGKSLKERELELKCEKLEQDIHRRREEIENETSEKIKGDIVEGLQIIRDAYMRLKLSKATTDKLMSAFDKALGKINKIDKQKRN